MIPFSHFPIFKKHLGNKVYSIIFTAIIIGLLDGIGIISFIPLLMVIEGNVNSEDLGFSVNVYKFFTNIYNYFSITLTTSNMLIMISLLFFVKGIIIFLCFSIISIFRGQLLRKLKKNIFSKYLTLDYEYFCTKKTGYFTNILNAEMTKALESYHEFCWAIMQIINVIIYTSFLLLISPMIGIFSLIFFLVMLLFFKSLNNFVKRVSIGLSLENGRLSNYLIESLHSLKYIEMSRNRKFVETRVHKSIEKTTNLEVRTGIASAFTGGLQDPVIAIAVSMLIAVQVFYLGASMELIMVALLFFYRCLSSIISFQKARQNMLENIGGLLIIDSELEGLKVNIEQTIHHEQNLPLEKIEFKDVSYFHPGASKATLQNINFLFTAPFFIGLVGASGSGKSTLIELLTLLRTPTAGKILYNGKRSNPEKILSGIRIGYVGSGTPLYDGTILENITTSEIETNFEVREAAIIASKKASILDFINSLAEGFETKVGDRGILLSSGQQQRILIARELYRRPKLLILDEATNHLDEENEKIIFKSLKKLRDELSLIVISHRSSSLKDLDQYISLENGNIKIEKNLNSLTDKIIQET